eukprot:5406777-Pleurochrysis_carterae.AAC.1
MEQRGVQVVSYVQELVPGFERCSTGLVLAKLVETFWPAWNSQTALKRKGRSWLDESKGKRFLAYGCWRNSKSAINLSERESNEVHAHAQQ